MLNNIRIEEDLLGTREVPADAYYGVHTLRAIENFYISNSKISDIPEFVRGMVMVKGQRQWPTKSCKPFLRVWQMPSSRRVMKS
jgi:aspartate ammonia-lyase